MNKPAKTAFAVAIAALAIVPKAHATTNEESAVIADDIATHGSIVCNPAWLDRIRALAGGAPRRKAASPRRCVAHGE